MSDFAPQLAGVERLPWGPIGSPHRDTNDERADSAYVALRAFEKCEWFVDNADAHETAIVDLLANLHHLCRREGLDWDWILERAESTHATEQAECEDNFAPLGDAVGAWREEAP